MKPLQKVSASIFILLLLCYITHIQTMHTETNRKVKQILSHSDTLFMDKKNPHLYWKALLLAAKKKKEEALKIVTLIKSGNNGSPDLLSKEDESKNIDVLFDKLFLSEVCRNPQRLSSIGLLESIGIYDHNAYLNNISPRGMLLDLEKKEANLKLLLEYSVKNLSPEQKVSYKIFLWDLNHAIRGKKFLFHDYHISHMFGVLDDLTKVFTEFHPLKENSHVHWYMARLVSIPKQLKQGIDLLKYQKELGIIPPKCTLTKMINLIEKQTSSPIEENIFYLRLDKAIKKINTPNKEELLEKVVSIIERYVNPAYNRFQEYLKDLRKEATNNGAWALPNGDEYYRYKLQTETTTNLSPDEIHELGLQEVEKVQTKIDECLKKIKDELNIKENVTAQDVFNDKRHLYPQTEEGRQQCLRDYSIILERSREKLSHLFDLKPKAPVKIKAVPKHEEEDTLSFPYYLAPSIDGSRPGLFFVNLGYLHESPKFQMETVTIHESEPGHHFQIGLQVESNIPTLRKLAEHNAYVEGWALYTERLALEQGFYCTPLDELGHYMDEMLRAARLVIDTGIHHKRWTREEAIEYMKKTTGLPEGTVISEIERYFVMPGQACSYKIGQLKILELRQRAKDKLGTKFDIREFHNVILKIASTPLEILEEVVEEYIQKKLES